MKPNSSSWALLTELDWDGMVPDGALTGAQLSTPVRHIHFNADPKKQAVGLNIISAQTPSGHGRLE